MSDMADDGTDEIEYFTLRRSENGETYVHSPDEVLVVALNERGAVALNVEPSTAFAEDVLVLPGGTVEPGEDGAATANRELQEEIGLRARLLDDLGELRAWSKYLSVRSHIYLARDLVESKLPGDEKFDIRVEWTPLDAFEDLIASGRLLDARVIAALLLARRALAQEAGQTTTPETTQETQP